MGVFRTAEEHQLGFGELLAEAEADNARRLFERQTADLPGTMREGVAFYRSLIAQHHAAMLAADTRRVQALREQARLLARKLNGGEPGYLSHDDASGCVLARETAAKDGEAVLWGQSGCFILQRHGTRIRIEMEGLLGIASHDHWLGFATHAVDADAPFISATGYRSFLGVSMELAAGITPQTFAATIIDAYVRRELKGRLMRLEERYQKRLMEDAASKA